MRDQNKRDDWSLWVMFMVVEQSVCSVNSLISRLKTDVFSTNTVEKLLAKVKFNQKSGDHLIFVGDLINKGPDSTGVIDLARQYSASSVRGNHEDRILLYRRDMIKTKTLASSDDALDSSYSSKELSERALARSLTDEQVKWLENCPVILDVGQIPNMGQVVVVHAGLVPDIELDKQDPASVMTMRTIDLDTHVPSAKKKGMNWAKVGSFIPVFLLQCKIRLMPFRCSISTNRYCILALNPRPKILVRKP
jgi:hypothetical protein